MSSFITTNTSSLVFPVFFSWQLHLQHLSAHMVLIPTFRMVIPSQSRLSVLLSKPGHFQCNTSDARNFNEICSYKRTPETMFLMLMTLLLHAANVTRRTLMISLIMLLLVLCKSLLRKINKSNDRYGSDFVSLYQSWLILASSDH